MCSLNSQEKFRPLPFQRCGLLHGGPRVVANSDASPFSFGKKAHGIFPWQSPSSAANNTKILELSVCYLRCVHAPQDTEVLSFSLFYASAP